MRKDKVISEVFGEELAITPSELCNAELRHAMFGGYATAEVDELLERVANVMESLIQETRRLKDEAAALKDEIEQHHQMETTLRNALVSSQKFAEDIGDAARRQADALIEEARVEQQRILAEDTALPEKLRREIETMRSQRDRLKADLAGVIETHRRLLESLEKEDEPVEVERAGQEMPWPEPPTADQQES